MSYLSTPLLLQGLHGGGAVTADHRRDLVELVVVAMLWTRKG
jgi:hypothetical protein